MADMTTSPDTGSSTPSDARYPGTPGWVKISGIVVLVLVLIVGGLHLAGHGMGPGMHGASAGGH